MNASDIPNWDKQPSADRLVYLRAAFLSYDIKNAKRRDLEDYLVVLANAKGRDTQEQRDEIARFGVTVQQLLQVRISEELHWRSMIAAALALVISVLSLYVAWHKNGHPDKGSSQSAPSPAQQAPSK